MWLTESLLLAGAGLIGGLLRAWWGTRALVALAPEGRYTEPAEEIGTVSIAAQTRTGR